MVLDINLLSPALMLKVFDQIEDPMMISEKLNWRIRYMTKIEFIDPKYGPDNIFTCLTNSNILSFSRGDRDSSLFFASLFN